MTLYAAYAANLDPRRMSERCPHSPLRGTGWLQDWRLTFGGEDHGWDGALTTIVPDPFEQVFIAIYDLADEDQASLESWDSIDTGLFRPVRVRVSLLDGEVVATTYVLDAFEGGLPSATHLGAIADAAEASSAPHDYVQALRARPCRSVFGG